VTGLVYRQGVVSKLIVCVCVCVCVCLSVCLSVCPSVCMSEHVIDHCARVTQITGAVVLVCRLLQNLCRAFLIIGYTIFIVLQKTLHYYRLQVPSHTCISLNA